jgi:cob(I)alamin adenosyltransferase
VKIYTRQGDAGETGLRYGDRVPKSALRVEAYGSVDEANAAIAMALTHLEELPHDARGAAGDGGETSAAMLAEMLSRVTRELFDLGADLSIPAGRAEAESPRVTAAHTERLEKDIDSMEAALPPLKRFILPGGGRTGAALHFARTVVRRAERCVVTLAASEAVGPEALRYLNRLSDFLFVAARAAAQVEGVPETEVEW